MLKKMILAMALFTGFQSTLQASATADIIMGFDCSGSSCNGLFGKDYGKSLHWPEEAFTRPRRGKDVISPIQWALRLFMGKAPLIDLDGDIDWYGIGSPECFQNDQVFSMDQLAEGDTFEAAYQAGIEKIRRSGQFGSDLNPIPFMKLVLQKISKSQVSEQTLGVIFSSGDMERSRKEEFVDLLSRSSKLFPVKWVFLVVGEKKEHRYIESLVSQAKKKSDFPNAKVIYLKNYFDFDGIFTASKFDCTDSTKESKQMKLYNEIAGFLRQDADIMSESIKTLRLKKDIDEGNFLNAEFGEYE